MPTTFAPKPETHHRRSANQSGKRDDYRNSRQQSNRRSIDSKASSGERYNQDKRSLHNRDSSRSQNQGKFINTPFDRLHTNPTTVEARQKPRDFSYQESTHRHEVRTNSNDLMSRNLQTIKRCIDEVERLLRVHVDSQIKKSWFDNINLSRDYVHNFIYRTQLNSDNSYGIKREYNYDDRYPVYELNAIDDSSIYKKFQILRDENIHNYGDNKNMKVFHLLFHLLLKNMSGVYFFRVRQNPQVKFNQFVIKSSNDDLYQVYIGLAYNSQDLDEYYDDFKRNESVTDINKSKIVILVDFDHRKKTIYNLFGNIFIIQIHLAILYQRLVDAGLISPKER